MKYYCVQFALEDDYDASDIRLTYPSNGTQTTASLADLESIEPEVDFALEVSPVPENAVAVIRFDKDTPLTLEGAAGMDLVRQYIETATGLKTIGFVDDMDVLIQNADDAIAMLNGMIAKIKIQQGAPSSSIILQ